MSRARIFERPVQAILISFPTACAACAVGSDLIARLSLSQDWQFVGYVLTIATSLTALIAAVPGILDCFLAFQRGVSSKSPEAVSSILDGILAGVFIAAWALKNRGPGAGVGWGVLGLEIGGGLAVWVSARYGGALWSADHVGGVIDMTDVRIQRKARALNGIGVGERSSRDKAG